MKTATVLLALILFGCGGSLTEEQRRQMHEKMELNKIVHVTEVQIMEEAYAEGRKLMEILDSLKKDSTQLKLFLKRNEGKIHYIQPGNATARGLEQQLVDAYLADETGALQDNVQEKRNPQGGYDSLLYTKPITVEIPGGGERLEGIWNIWLSKKELVLEIGKNSP